MDVGILLGVICCHRQKYLASYVIAHLTVGYFRPLGSVSTWEIAKPEEMELFIMLSLRAEPF